ncbi:TraB/GumN family protein [Paenibacillus filicis]|uniref:TraB/GumN family protein n=1 Tax=Paenibacillus filicis TaxID=669464 RepID=A0ABU9DFZ5_9BACL
MKKISTLLLSLFLVTAAFSSVQAAEKPSSIRLNGEQIQFGASEPILENGVTLVPMRPILEKLDIEVNWDEATQTARGAKEGLSFSLQIGSANAMANNQGVQLEVAPKLIRNVTYVPLRFIAETVGYQVGWNPSLRQVTLTSKQQSEGGRGFLWKIENKGNTVYLLGSIHVADESMYPLRPEIENAFTAADDLSVEVDLSTIDPVDIQKQIVELGIYNDGTTLKDHISVETYTKLTAFLKTKGMPEHSFDKFKPWLVNTQLSNLNAANDGLKPGMGIDEYLIEKANKAGKPIISLESADSNYKLNNGFSDALQERLLLLNLDPNSVVPPAPDVSAEYLARIWKEGNYDALAESTQSSGWDAEYYKGLLTNRDLAMAEKIKAYLNSDKQQTHMVVVGFSHMLGDYGIVRTLEKEGFKAEKQ